MLANAEAESVKGTRLALQQAGLSDVKATEYLMALQYLSTLERLPQRQGLEVVLVPSGVLVRARGGVARWIRVRNARRVSMSVFITCDQRTRAGCVADTWRNPRPRPLAQCLRARARDIVVHYCSFACALCQLCFVVGATTAHAGRGRHAAARFPADQWRKCESKSHISRDALPPPPHPRQNNENPSAATMRSLR